MIRIDKGQMNEELSNQLMLRFEGKGLDQLHVPSGCAAPTEMYNFALGWGIVAKLV